MEAERVTEVRVSAYTVPTDFPESDGTLEWNATTVVLVEIWSGTTRGLGFTYGDLSTAGIVDHVLSPLVLGHDPMAISSAWLKQLRRVRNFTRPGIASLAIAAVDSALWDLKARLLGIRSFHCWAGYATPFRCTEAAGLRPIQPNKFRRSSGNGLPSALRK